jgi:hypothetical protein
MLLLMLINRFLGTEELPVQAQNHMRLFLSLSMMIGFLTSLSSTFYILFVIDKIGSSYFINYATYSSGF